MRGAMATFSPLPGRAPLAESAEVTPLTLPLAAASARLRMFAPPDAVEFVPMTPMVPLP